MKRENLWVGRCASGLALALALAAGAAPAAEHAGNAGLTAAQVVDKFVAARGGRSAWQGVAAMSWSGKMDAGSGNSVTRSSRYISDVAMAMPRKERVKASAAAAPSDAQAQVELGFTYWMERPHKSRLELEFAGKTAVQAYDGRSGWKLRPFLNRSQVEPFTDEEGRAEAAQAGMDGLLMEAVAAGTAVELEGVEPVDGHDAYRLKLTARDGTPRHVWVDTQSFLDVKIEGSPRQMDGRSHAVWIYQRDFRSEQGLMIPHVLETAVDGYRERRRLVIDKVRLNPRIDEGIFLRPGAQRG